MGKSILELIKSTGGLPAQPTIAVEVLRLTRQENTNVDELIKVIERDSALTAQILKIVNSSLYALPKKIASVKQAVVALGMRAVKIMAMSLSLVDAIRKGPAEKNLFDFPLYWRRSLSTAVGARLLAQHVDKRLAEDAFVGGLLADIGMAAAQHSAPAMYEPVLAIWQNGNAPLSDVERKKLGVTHSEMGAELLRAWALPDSLCSIVATHHGDGLMRLEGDTLRMAMIVCAAARVSGVFVRDDAPESFVTTRDWVMQQLNIAPTDLDAIFERLNAAVKETAAMFAVQVSEEFSYAQITVEAGLQLAKLTLEAEQEKGQAEQTARAKGDEVVALKKQNATIKEEATTDPLTQIANRAAFEKKLEEELRRSQDRNRPVSLLMMDVDFFKKFNDEHGHQAGDAVLKHVAQTVRKVVDRDGFVARYGGEEFVVIATNTGQQLRELAEEIRRAIEASPCAHGGKELHVTTSVGAASLIAEAGKETRTELIDAADRCLYKAKRAGRNRVELAGEAAETTSSGGGGGGGGWLRKLFGGRGQ